MARENGIDGDCMHSRSCGFNDDHADDRASHLHPVDVLHERALGLVPVTLNLEVQLVVLVLRNLLRLPVLPQHTPQDSQPPDPDGLEWQTGVGGTLALTHTSVTALAHRSVAPQLSRPGVDDVWLADNEAILDQLLDVLSAVGQGDLAGLIWVQPAHRCRNT